MFKNEELFAEAVTILETSLTQPYLLDGDISTFSDIADELNNRGYRNARGRRLTGNTLKLMFWRMDDADRQDFREKYYPSFWCGSEIDFRESEKVRKARLDFHDWEIEAFKSDYRDAFVVNEEAAFEKYSYMIFSEQSNVA